MQLERQTDIQTCIAADYNGHTINSIIYSMSQACWFLFVIFIIWRNRCHCKRYRL